MEQNTKLFKARFMIGICKSLAVLFFVAGMISQTNNLAAAGLTEYEIKPSEADPEISRFNEPNFVIANLESNSSPRLVSYAVI